jgi:hypothetical protein
MKLKTLIAAGAIILFASISHADFVVNGDFAIEVPSNGIGGGWTSNHIVAGGWHNELFILNWNGALEVDPSIEQTLTGLVAGREYLIEGDYCNFYGLGYCNVAALSFGVEVQSNVILELSYPGSCNQYYPFEASFIADATEQTIRFSAERNGSDCDYAIDNIVVTALADVVACSGFEPPMADYPVTVKKSRALPLKAEVFDADGFALTDADLATAPVVQVWFDSGEGGDAVDVTDDVLSVGQGDEGNQFVFTEGERWQFNLSTKNYTSPGTYTVLMQSGDDSEYVIEPTCITEFVIK